MATDTDTKTQVMVAHGGHEQMSRDDTDGRRDGGSEEALNGHKSKRDGRKGETTAEENFKITTIFFPFRRHQVKNLLSPEIVVATFNFSWKVFRGLFSKGKI